MADQGRSAAKRIVGRSDGSCETFAYDRVAHWFYAPKLVSGHAGMARLLAALATRPDVMLVMGGVRTRPRPIEAAAAPLGRSRSRERTLWSTCPAHGWRSMSTATACRRRGGWPDTLPTPPPQSATTRWARNSAGVECVVAATSRTGLAGEEEARLRLFFLLGQPHALADLRRWAQGAQAAGLPVDPSIFQPGQPVYTARPRFEGALRDPVPEPLRAFVLPAGGGGDRVALDVHRYDQRAREIEARMRHAEASCDGNWRRLLAATLGGPASFSCR